MGILEEKNIVQCQCCGNRDGSLIVERDGGYVCKCCGVWYKKNPTEAEFREQMWVMQGYSQLRSYRFGDARDTFENILAEHPNSINALWGLILSRYGVVYIKGFYKGVVEPIYCFPNYERMKRRYVQNEPEYEQIMGLLKGDNTLRFEYEKKAEKIDDALDEFKKFKETTDRDVFICVKISAATTRHPELTGRTKDYEFALDVYNELTRRGVNAFYSFITLENDVKSDEKIWRNLVKSKKMLLIGSNEEYLESPWVKSEWKRWLHLRREDDLYVCVLHESDESPFDILPQEISDLEPQIYTQDMRDRLINHICKGLGVESEDETAAALEEAKRERERKEAAAAQQERLRREAEAVEYTRKRREAEEAEQERKRKEAAQSKQNGKIVYSDGREEVLEYGITEIASNAYMDNSNIVSIVLPESVKIIGDMAFARCANLTNIIIPKGVTSIGSYAFFECHSLIEAEIPDTVNFIGEYVFYDCDNLKSLSIPNTFANIESGAFGVCRKLTDITIPPSVKSIGASAFANCSGLTSITIPDSVTSVGDMNFYGLASIKDIYYGGTKAQWQKISFGKENDCISNATVHFAGDANTHTARKSAQTKSKQNGKIVYSDGREEVLEYGITEIQDDAYFEEEEIVSVVLPNSVTSIGRSAFDGCAELKSVTVPESVTSIGNSAFAYCYELTDITLPDSVTFIDRTAFSNCRSLKDIAIPKGVTSIEYGTFNECGSLSSVTIPSSVTSIGAYAFYECGSLTDIHYDGTKTQWQKISVGADNDALANAEIHFSAPKSAKSTRVTSQSTKTSRSASQSTKTTRSAPQNVKPVQSAPKSGKLIYSDGRAEALDHDLAQLKEKDKSKRMDIVGIVLPDGLTEISRYAFNECQNLESIEIPSGITAIGEYAFYNCKKLKEIKIPSGVKTIGEHAFYNCQSLKEITIPDGVSSIGEKAFSYCLALTGIKLPGSLTAVSAYTFNACPFLKSVVIPEGVTKIGEGAFESCENLVSAELPESVTEIGECAFGYCTALESIEIPDGVSTIEASTFTWCKSLASVTLSSGLRTIGASAFNVCKGLVSIKIPASVTEIGECAFDICTNITDIYYEGSKYDWARIDIGKGNAKLNGLFGRAKIHFNSI